MKTSQWEMDEFDTGKSLTLLLTNAFTSEILNFAL